jgi:hypothetical protein
MNHLLSLGDNYGVCPYPFEEGEYSEYHTDSDSESVLNGGTGNGEASTELESERNTYDDTGFEAEDEEGAFSEDSTNEPFEGYEEEPNKSGTGLNSYDIFTGSMHTASEDTLSSEVELPTFASRNDGSFNTRIASSELFPSRDFSPGTASSDEGFYNPINPPLNTPETPKPLKRPAPEGLPQWTPSPSKYESANRNKRQRITLDVENDLEITEGFNSTEIRIGYPAMEGVPKSIKVRDDYLHKLPKEEVFKQLIDCFRLYMENKFSKKIDRYNMPVISLAFEDMLGEAACRYGFMPSWWDHRAYEKCVEVARDRRRCECSIPLPAPRGPICHGTFSRQYLTLS